MSKTASYTTPPITAGAYTNPNVTVNQHGVVTAIANGSSTTTACVMSINVAAAIPGSTFVPWDTTISDPLGMYNVGLRGIIAPTTGIYMISVCFYNGTTATAMAIYVNGVQVAANQSVVNSIYYNMTAIYPVTAGQLIQVRTGGVAALTVANTALYNFGVAKFN